MPAIGRPILPFDDEQWHPARVAMLSFGYWRRAFNEDRSVVGKYLHVANATFLIVGVAPEDFFGLVIGEAPDLWLPLTAHPSVFPGADWLVGKKYELAQSFRAGSERHRHGPSSGDPFAH